MNKLTFATLLLSITTLGCNPTPSTDNETEHPKTAIVKQITYNYHHPTANFSECRKWLFHYDNDKLIKVDESVLVQDDDISRSFNYDIMYEREKDLITVKDPKYGVFRYYYDSLEGKLLTCVCDLTDQTFNIDYTYQEDKIILANIDHPSFRSATRAFVWEDGNMKALSTLSGEGLSIQYTDCVNNSNVDFMLYMYPSAMPQGFHFIPMNGLKSKNLPSKMTYIPDAVVLRTFSYTFNNEGLVSTVKITMPDDGEGAQFITLQITYQ